MSRHAALAGAALSVAVFSVGCTATSTESGPTAPIPTAPPTATEGSAAASVAPPTTSTTSPETTTAAATTNPATTQPGTTAPGTNPASVPAAATDKTILTDIPGEQIDYVPDVAAKLNIDVPGQYYEVLPKLYFFIPAEDSPSNPTLRTPKPEDIPMIEAYVRAKAALWAVYTSDPIPPDGSEELRAAFTERGYVQLDEIIRDAAAADIHTIIRGGDINVPRLAGDADPNSILDCGWYDQYDLGPGGATSDDRDRKNAAGAKLTLVADRWIVDALYEDPKACE